MGLLFMLMTRLIYTRISSRVDTISMICVDTSCVDTINMRAMYVRIYLHNSLDHTCVCYKQVSSLNQAVLYEVVNFNKRHAYSFSIYLANTIPYFYNCTEH